ncbi:MAG: hypothetical protein IPP62_18595 [bacterium]|nr:hypothetical protein [bacterium]
MVQVSSGRLVGLRDGRGGLQSILFVCAGAFVRLDEQALRLPAEGETGIGFGAREPGDQAAADSRSPRRCDPTRSGPTICPTRGPGAVQVHPRS